MPVDRLDSPCGACGRPAGDHTLREWADCLGTTTTDLPYEPVEDDAVELASRNLRERFQLDEDVIIADHVLVTAATLDGQTGKVRIRIPALLHEWQIGRVGRPPVTVAKVAFLGEPHAMRQYGRLARDSANGAANAAERAA